MTNDGCPGSDRDKVSAGYLLRKSYTRIPMQANVSKISFVYEENILKEDVCIHESEYGGHIFEFPPGNYCIYQYQTKDCSRGFNQTIFMGVEHVFRKYNQPTILYERENCLFLFSFFVFMLLETFIARNYSTFLPSK